eukprot:TRINITY_DN2572_c0_g3_i1.p1 TRINITY_DN2572_c0_g3~~TRINITY_DN2572_c0_g3_i1.p1  ORF type:complete len:161 (+),score=47.41 TRINITY_DN2572_c0_g3_i1:95-577(+)
MAALLSYCCSSSSTFKSSFFPSFHPKTPTTSFHNHQRSASIPPIRFHCSSRSSSEQNQKEKSFSLRESALSIALAIGLMTGMPTLGLPAFASHAGSALPDVSVLISGPPIKDPGALLRYALPIDNKAIREVQKPLEDITESLKLAGVKALNSVERVRKIK